MCKRLIIIGAGGHGKVIADLAVKNGYGNIAFLDDITEGFCVGYPILGKTSLCSELNDGKTEFVIAIGSNEVRKTISKKYDLPWATLVHPSAQIGLNVEIGTGTVVMSGAAINSCANIGSHCIINTHATVEHDNVVSSFAHISPNVALGGTVHIGECAHIGIGATVKNNISICENAVVGAGAVVVKDIDEKGVYVGVPARRIK